MKEQILSKFLKKEKFLLTYTENLSKHIFLFFYIRNSMRKHFINNRTGFRWWRWRA